MQAEGRLSWRFPWPFWVANGAELLERAAYYGMAIALAVYLTDQIGFTDVSTGYVAGAFTSVLYLLPTFTGLMADRIGFRRALILAFALLTLGYCVLGLGGMQIVGADAVRTPLFAEFPRKAIVLCSLLIIMVGGSIIKPVITGTAAVCSDEAHRARAFSIFYAVVNIGSFTGKSLAAPVRQHLGLEYINFYAGLMAGLALIWVALLYRDVEAPAKARTLRDAMNGLLRVVSNIRFMCLILIVAGFWAIQHQLYASMPKYILRMLGETAKPEWLANINPLVVVILVVPITHLVRRMRPVNTIGISLAIIPVSSLVISLSPALQASFGGSVSVGFGCHLHPITLMVILGIGLQGLAECFLSPKWLEYASKQAPKGEVGLYMGYMHLTSFFAYLFGFVISGYLLDWFCPDPNTLPPDVQQARLEAIANATPLPDRYAQAHYIWYVFAAIGVLAFLGLLLFRFVTRRIDAAREASND